MKHLLTLVEARPKFDRQWTLLGAGVALLSSVRLLEFGRPEVFFWMASVAGVVIGGWAVRRVLSHHALAEHFMFIQRCRMIILAVAMLFLAGLARDKNAILMVLAGMTLWLVMISVLLQMGIRFAPAQAKSFAYAQYLGDLLVAIFLAVWGADWSYVAGVLAIAAPTALASIPSKDRRVLPVVLLSAAALFLFGIPPAARWFAIYMIAVIGISAWGIRHLVIQASHLRDLTASASDESITR